MPALLALIPLRVWLYGAAGLALLALAWFSVTKIEERGADKLQTKIETQDRSAVNAAELARNRRRACVDGGGLWDTSTGQCGQR